MTSVQVELLWNSEKIPTVPTADEVLDRCFRRAAAKMKLRSRIKTARIRGLPGSQATPSTTGWYT